MRRIHIFLLTIITALAFSTGVSAQKIRGVVTDSLTNEPLLYVTVQYEGKGSGSVTNGDGEYEVDNHARRGWTELTFSAIGYETKKVKITTATRELTLKLKPADIQIAEVTVRPGRERYRRRENPAVIFMRKVIEKKKGLKLETNDYYERWNSLDNTQLEEGSYIDPFITSDAMIHDCGSFTSEYLHTKHPVMYLVKDVEMENRFSPFGKKCFNLHYHGHNKEEIERFIAEVVIGGNDPKRAERETFFDTYLGLRDGMTPSERIMCLRFQLCCRFIMWHSTLASVPNRC